MHPLLKSVFAYYITKPPPGKSFSACFFCIGFELTGVKIHGKVALPSAKPAFITVSLFSFVWYWNESYLTKLYVHGVLTDSGWTTLVLQLDNFAANFSSYATTAASTATNLNESINMAGTMLSILPLLLLYFVLQRHFVESIDRTGITGE